MAVSDYLAGVVFLTLMLAGVGAATALVARRRLGGLAGSARLLAIALVFALGVLAVHMAGGIAGILSPLSVLAATAIWLAIAARLPEAGDADRVGAPAPRTGSARLSIALAAVSAIALVLAVLAYGLDQLVVAPGSIDILNFHLPGVAGWMESGSMWEVHEFVADTSPGRYPANGDVFLLAAVLPWKSDFLSHFVPYGFLVLTGLAVYALARELAAPRAASASAACLVVAIPVVSVQALTNSFPDTVMLFGFAAGLTFLARHRRTRAAHDLVLAGLALGLSFGSKWYGVSAVAAAFAIWFAGSAIERRGLRRVARDGAVLASLIGLAGGFWLVRNLVFSGNPFHPVALELFGVTIFDAPADPVRELGGQTLASYVGDSGIWGPYIWPQLREVLAWPALLVVAGYGAVLIALGSRPGRRSPGFHAALPGAALAAALFAIYTVTPYTAGGGEGMPVLVEASSRYVVPALVVGAALLAWASGLWRRGELAFCLVATVAVADGVRIVSQDIVSFTALEPADWLGAAAVLAVIAGLAALVAGALRRPRSRLRPVALGAGAVALVALVAGGHRVAERYLADRYRGIDATGDWIAENAETGRRIGIAGAWINNYSPVLPAFGPRFGNEVEFVGSFVEGTLRSHPEREPFVEALERGDYDVLVIGRGIPPRERPPEESWARAAGFEPVAESPTLIALRAG